MRTLIISLVALAAFIPQPARTLASQVDVQLITPTPTTWQIWVMDDSNTADKGIDLFGLTITPLSGTVSCPISTGCLAPADNADDANQDVLGFSPVGTFGSDKTSLIAGALQETVGGLWRPFADSAVFGIGQAPSALNNNGNFIGYTDLAGDVVKTNTNPYAAGNNIAGWVEMFAGTNNVANSIDYSSLSGFGADVFDNNQPSDGATYTQLANLDAVPSMLLIPEPATVTLLAFAGVMALARRRHRRHD
jgi:hypothetical protein